MPNSKDAIGALDRKTTAKIVADYANDAKNTIIRHALSRNTLSDVGYCSEALADVSLHFSVEVKTMSVCNQRSSGRCWIFAGLNLLREIIAKKAKISNFQLSQNYISLYDKIEKANYALETIVKLAKNDPDDRVFAFILGMPVSDGGQWDMFVNLVKKYGLVPQEAFPETAQSNATRETDQLVNAAIRGFAAKAHKLALDGKDDEVRALKDETMEKIYHMFLNAFGVPPTSFRFQYSDTKGKLHSEEDYTPKSFYEKWIGDEEIDSYQSLINSPTADKPFGKNYTIDYLGNVIEGKNINHLNVTMEKMKKAIIAQLKSGTPVWFGSDVSFFRDRSSYAWDDKAIDYVSLVGFPVVFDKADMLDYKHSAMNHAMLITGVDIVDGKPTKWKIENSWGADSGSNGYYVMSASWFDLLVYQAVVKKEFLSEEDVAAAAKEPIHLNPWDPMGTLAD